MQSLPLEAKIIKTKMRIREWYDHWDGDVCINFSGGKDSTVLLHIVREVYPNVEAVYVDTGLEFPEIREFVKTINNVIWLKPTMRFDQLIKEYGYPVISKEVANALYYAKKDSRWAKNMLLGLDPDGTYNTFKQRYVKWGFLQDAPFKISDRCCSILKEKPLKLYQKTNSKKPFIGLMATDSTRRKQAYLKTGCNAFDNVDKTSKPLGFWTEQDILKYIRNYNIPYCKVYGDIIEDKNGKLYTSGEHRTGCMFCMFGCHLEKEPNKFQRMKITHPKLYDYCINKLGLKEVLEYINVSY